MRDFFLRHEDLNEHFGSVIGIAVTFIAAFLIGVLWLECVI